MKLLRHLLFWCVLVLVGALLAQWWLGASAGEQVLVRYGGYDVRFTPLTGLALLVTVVLVAWLLWQALLLPLRWSHRRARRRCLQFNAGLLALHLGQFARAERELGALTSSPELALVARLTAARAALVRGDGVAARAHLAGLDVVHPGAYAIAQAELALAEFNPDAALAALDAPAAQPLPPRGLALRADALAGSGHSLAAYELVGVLRKEGVWPLVELQRREQMWAEAALHEAADAEALSAAWERLAKPLRAQADLHKIYTARAALLGLPGAHDERDANGVPQWRA